MQALSNFTLWPIYTGMNRGYKVMDKTLSTDTRIKESIHGIDIDGRSKILLNDKTISNLLNSYDLIDHTKNRVPSNLWKPVSPMNHLLLENLELTKKVLYKEPISLKLAKSVFRLLKNNKLTLLFEDNDTEFIISLYFPNSALGVFYLDKFSNDHIYVLTLDGYSTITKSFVNFQQIENFIYENPDLLV
jgi:hypothetical protein